MAINYFEDLGFGANLREGMSNLANGLMYQQQKQEQQAQQAKKEQKADLQFANEQQKLRAARAAGAFYNALQSGDDAAAIQILRENKAEVDSLGDPSFTTERIEPLLKTPEGRKQMMQSAAGLVQLAAGPDKFAQYVQAQMPKQEAPMSQLDAERLKIDQGKLALDQGKFDFEKEQAKLARMQGYQTTVADELKRQELQSKIDEQQRKIEEAKAKSVTAKNEKAAQLEAAQANIDNMLNTIARVSATPMDTISAAVGPVDQMFPTVQQDVADFEELVGTLGSQAFLSQIPLIKGMGALSNAEGEKLQSALQNFSLRQSPERLIENLAEAQRLLNKTRANVAKQYGVENGTPDTPAANNAPKYKIIEVR